MEKTGFETTEETSEVKKFHLKCCDIITENALVSFDYRTLFRFRKSTINSPIEQLLLLGLETIKFIECLYDLDIQSQYVIGNFRTDFAIKWRQNQLDSKIVLIECDSQLYHERTEAERRYEKTRDRFIKYLGQEILHFTGKEIIENPLRIASEIIGHIVGEQIYGDY